MVKSNKGVLYMIPCPIVLHYNETLPPQSIDITHTISHFIVERERTARRWLSSIDHPTPIHEMTFLELDKNNPNQDISTFLSVLSKGTDVGVISEAGCPGIADPGHRAVAFAQHNGYKVVPLVGPNSILLALMASGFSGQSFAFHGYLPNKKPELLKRLKQLDSNTRRQTQIWMEAPYRNAFMIECCIAAFSPMSLLCVACDINSETESIKTMTLEKWKKEDLKKYHKRPCIFVMGGRN